MNLLEFLKANAQALGIANPEELAGKLAEVSKATNVDVIVNNSKEPSYIPKSRFDELVGQKNELKTQVGELTNQLETVKKEAKGNEGLTKTIEDLQLKNKGWEDKYADLAKVSAVKLQASTAKVKAEAMTDIVKFIDLSKVTVKEDGSVEGLKEQFDSLSKDKAFLFDVTAGGTGTPGTPGAGGKGASGDIGIGKQLADQAAANAKAAQTNTNLYFG